MLNPQVVMNLLPEFRISMDLMGLGRWGGRRLRCGAGWFVAVTLSTIALRSETNEFHKRLSFGLTAPSPRETKNHLDGTL